jgi:hypothetical protein
MIRSLPFVAVLAAVASVAFAKGPLETVDRGPYVCELPGDAAGEAGIAQPDHSFKIESSSRYGSPQGEGTYLRVGNRLEMTSGPRKGETYLVVHMGYLRFLQPDGKPSRLRCIVQG